MDSPYMGRRAPKSFWVLEDTSSYHERDLQRISGNSASPPIALRLYRVRDRKPELVAETRYTPRSERRRRDFKGRLALELLRQANVREGIVVAGPRFLYGGGLLRRLTQLNLNFVVALPSPVIARRADDQGTGTHSRLHERLSKANWRATSITAPGSEARYSICELGRVAVGNIRGLRCLALSTGGISDFRRGLVVGVASLGHEVDLRALGQLLGWSRWIRFVSRRSRKDEAVAHESVAVRDGAEGNDPASRLINGLTVRANLKIANRQDQAHAVRAQNGLFAAEAALRAKFTDGRSRINVVELFAGAGGMGLGFLMAGTGSSRYRLLFSGEIDPVYATTLRVNHDFLRRNRVIADSDVPEDTTAVDLRAPSVMDRVQSIVSDFGRADIVVGGPPCQGFSNANRNSWSSSNPNNRLVDTYLDYVVRLRPRVFIMENVQGILWTPRHASHDRLSVAEHVATRLARAGYRIFPKLLDAAWYGVPQHRNRFFLLGLHADLDYGQEDFGDWGPFPPPTHGPMTGRPYTTVRQAIADLPPIENGASKDEVPYATSMSDAGRYVSEMRHWAPEGVVWDHVTSQHAAYVIERYTRIPAGGNWSDITEMMTNYADVGRTHSNIYRRLVWDEPSITIGHYRKAMLVHPDQNRGLSLREASRLQSFPDWFRFAGGDGRLDGGLTYKQQQLGNAVCPLVTKEIAALLLKL